MRDYARSLANAKRYPGPHAATEDRLREEILTRYVVGTSFEEGWLNKVKPGSTEHFSAIGQSPEVLAKLPPLGRMSLTEADAILKKLVDAKLEKVALEQVSEALRDPAFPEPAK